MLIIVQRIVLPVYLWLILKEKIYLEQLVKARSDIYSEDNFFSLLLPLPSTTPACGRRHKVLIYFLLSHIILPNGEEWTEELEINQCHSFELGVEQTLLVVAKQICKNIPLLF